MSSVPSTTETIQGAATDQRGQRRVGDASCFVERSGCFTVATILQTKNALSWQRLAERRKLWLKVLTALHGGNRLLLRWTFEPVASGSTGLFRTRVVGVLIWPPTCSAATPTRPSDFFKC